MMSLCAMKLVTGDDACVMMMMSDVGLVGLGRCLRTLLATQLGGGGGGGAGAPQLPQ
jgi:hypothetical protein